MKKWRIEDSEELYNIKGWGVNYFGINDKGHVYVTPKKNGVQVDLKDVIDELSTRHVTAPVLLRFPDILDNRIEKTDECFRKAAKEYDYQAEHFIIFPVKVNQMRPVVEEIISHGKRYNLGLEAGSKPELHAVLATNMDSDSLIICNGHKDQNFIELALLAQKMGKRVFLVIEKLPELKIIAETAQRLGVRPNLGIRIKLAANGSGKWSESGGDASKFGLNSSELLMALQLLDEMGLRDCLKLLHFHIGSQITKIRRISTALREAAQFYVQLHSMGFGIEFIDCGGGLGVDYDGTRSSNSESSVNYSIQEYVNDCVYNLVEAANKNGIPHPNIITEGGRSLTAHHSVLIVDVLESVCAPQMPEDFEPGEGDHKLVHDLTCSRTGMMPRISARKPSISSVTALSTSRHALRLNPSTGPSATRLPSWHTTRSTSPMSCVPWISRWQINTSAISRSSSRCPIHGHLTCSSPSCLLPDSMSSPCVAPRCRTSPATPTVRLRPMSTVVIRPTISLCTP